jgi:phosphoribosylformylglycinamidine synthase subunit PurSL
MRIELFYKQQYPDGRAIHLLHSLEKHFPGPVEAVQMVDVFLIKNIDIFTETDAKEVLSDPVAQDVLIDKCAGTTGLLPGWNLMAEITSKPGVTDPIAITARDALKNHLDHMVPGEVLVQTAQKYLFKAGTLSPEEEEKLLLFLHNPLIQTGTLITRTEWEKGKRFPPVYPHEVQPSPVKVESFTIINMDHEDLQKLSRTRLLALSLEEMKAIQAYFQKEKFLAARKQKGLSPGITDVEIEMIAQTWSEHCKHKIFNATISYKEKETSETVHSVFTTYIRNTTEKLKEKRGYLKSVFHDNSGVIQFDDETLLCFKVETHNSPSALDPYGGAITGIVGVNRDIIGTGIGAKPIFNTNYLCFGYPGTPREEVPEGILHPHQVMTGVHKGIIDGGNQSGIPVVAGGFLFDESYLGKPVVYCGTGGILPNRVLGKETWKKEIQPGDLAVMTGGRIGKDGIHGATFSSQALDEESPTSAVQIGDPITQKKMLDFIIEARDRGLYRGITDNGAGGLSSSLGEMAEISNGVKIMLDECPLKYQGLAPWEILVSESQERMSLAVSPEHIAEFLSLAIRRDVEATVVGEFTDSGYVEILYEGDYVGLLEMDFLHHGLPVMNLEAEWIPPRDGESPPLGKRDLKEDLLALLKDPNIASREQLVRQYDHEVQVHSVVKPFVGKKEDSHSDGAVLKPRYDSMRGITVTHGICPRYSDVDTYHMAMCAVDEAFRAHIALGGNPEEVSALDNFCWPDPLESETNPDAQYKLAQLVRACRGLSDACMAYSLPLISGKDSMKNDAIVGGRKISIRPTLLLSLMGIIPDIRYALTTDFKKPGDTIVVLGNTNGELGGTRFEQLIEREIGNSQLGKCPEVKADEAYSLYTAVYQAARKGLISSCHDLSDGGLAVALCESAIGGRLGADICLDHLPGTNTDTQEHGRILFCETPSRFIVTVAGEKKHDFLHIMKGLPCTVLGQVKEKPVITMRRAGETLLTIDLETIINAWKTPVD